MIIWSTIMTTGERISSVIETSRDFNLILFSIAAQKEGVIRDWGLIAEPGKVRP